MDNPLRCYIEGAISTFKSCDIDTNEKADIPNIRVVLDKELKIEDGMKPVIITIPNVRNFNPELQSGVLTIKTIYDTVILDESSTIDTNRKASTSLSASLISINSFIISPTTMG